MAIQWADFPSGQQGLYGSDESLMLNGVWAGLEESCTLIEDPDVNVDGIVLQTNTDTASIPSQASIALKSIQSTVGVGTRIFLTRLPFGSGTTGKPFIQYRTGANAAICSILVNPNGAIEVRSGSHSGTVLGTSAPCIVANGWQHIEVKVLRSETVGTIEVRVDGDPKLDLDTLNLGTVDIGIIALCMGTIADTVEVTACWKDFVIWDGTGSECNDFQGSVAVHDLFTDGDISLNWTPSTGSTGWDLLDEAPPSDLDYIQAGDPAPSPAVFSLTNLPPDVTSVRALLPIIRAVKTDGGDCNVQVSITPNNVDWDDGADRPMTTAYTWWWDVSHLSPDTSAPWTPVEVNAAYVKANRTL